MARPDHSVSCTRKTHKDGKWCWLPSEIEELRRQSVDGPMLTTWNKISKSFITNGINRHNTHQCHKKSFKLSDEKREKIKRKTP